MNSFVALVLLSILLALCNLSDKVISENSGDGNRSAPNNSASTPKPTMDRDAIRSELVRLANNMAEASKNGDISFLAENTTSDFEITDVSGKVQKKNQALADVKEEKSIRSWDIKDPELSSVSENDAVLKYVLAVTLTNGRSGRARITDTFVKQDGKWMLRSEQQTMMR